MNSVFALLLLLIFFLTQGATVESRKDAGRMMMKDEAMPEAIQGLLKLDSQIQSEDKPKTNEHKCEEPLVTETQKVTMQNKVFMEDFEQRVNPLIYNDDGKKKKTIKDFKPQPTLSSYNNDKIDSVNNDFEPRPGASAYNE